MPTVEKEEPITTTHERDITYDVSRSKTLEEPISSTYIAELPYTIILNEPLPISDTIIVKDKLLLADSLPLADILDIGRALYFESLSLSDVISTRKITPSPPLSESISLSDVLDVKDIRTETIRVYDAITVKKIIAESYTVSGDIYKESSPAALEKDVIVSLYRLSPTPRLNLTDYTVMSDLAGHFSMAGVPDGEYILAAQKYGLTLAWNKIIVDGTNVVANLTLKVLEVLKVVEGIYNRWGHIYKLYQYADYINEAYRFVEAILVLGDIYNSAADVSASLDGYLEPVSRDTTIELIPMEFLGNQGFFDVSEDIYQYGNKILFNSTVVRRDFEGLAFKLKFPKDIEGKARLVVAGKIWYEGPTYNTPPYRSISISGTAVDRTGNVISGATIVVYIKGTNIEVARATTDEYGYYVLPGMSQNTEYDIYISNPGYTSPSGLVTTGTNDIMDNTTYNAGKQYPGLWYYFSIIFIFPPMNPLDTDPTYKGDKIFGYVYNKYTLEKIPYALVKVEGPDGEIYTVMTDKYGFYEIFVPPGTYDVRGFKRAFHTPRIQRGTITSDLQVLIPLTPIKRIPLYDKVGTKFVTR